MLILATLCRCYFTATLLEDGAFTATVKVLHLARALQGRRVAAREDSRKRDCSQDELLKCCWRGELLLPLGAAVVPKIALPN